MHMASKLPGSQPRAHSESSERRAHTQGFTFYFFLQPFVPSKWLFIAGQIRNGEKERGLGLHNGDGERSEQISLYTCMEFSKIKNTF